MDYLGGEKAFLGREFLTWLWYQTEQGSGVFEHEGGQIGVVFDDYLAFVSDEEDAQETAVRKGHPARCVEAWTALLAGKKLSKARIQFAQGERSWSTLLKGDGLSASATKLPDPEVEAGDDLVLARLTDLEDGFALLDAMFAEFLAFRLSDAWPGFSNDCLTWARQKVSAFQMH